MPTDFSIIKKIDLAKLELEAKHKPKIKKLFTTIANDVVSLYINSNNLYDDLAENYQSDFISLIRIIMRDTANVFSHFEVNNKIEEKASSQVTQEEERQANSEFDTAIVLFIANQSEVKAKYITDTNKGAIASAVAIEERNAILQADKIQQEINKTLDENIRKRLIAKKNEILTRQAIAKNIKQNLLKQAENRANLISEDIVGATQSFTSYQDALLTAKLNPNNVYVKKWVAILDNKTREDHFKSDGQEVDLNGFFLVGGEKLLYPRDYNASLSQTAGCRCQTLIEKK